jgi:hypothetical protein
MDGGSNDGLAELGRKLSAQGSTAHAVSLFASGGLSVSTQGPGPSGLTVIRGLVYLHPSPSGGWEAAVPHRQDIWVARADALGELEVLAHEALGRTEIPPSARWARR